MEHSEYREEIEVGDHPYSYDHTEPKASALFLFGGATVLMLIVVGVGITYYYDALREQAIYREVLSVDNDQLKNLRATEERDLNSYSYANKDAGVVRMPISRAMQLVAKEAAENKPKYPVKPYAVKTPEQLAGQAPAVSQPGAASAQSAVREGSGSNPNVQQPSSQ